MTIDSVVDLQLALMKPDEAEVVANITKKADDDWHELGATDYDLQLLPGKIEAIRKASLGKAVIIVGKMNGVIVASYKPSAFEVDEDKSLVLGKGRFIDAFGSRQYSLGNTDLFAVSEERRGIGTLFFEHFGKIMEHVALKVGISIPHRVTATHRSNGFYERLSYKQVAYTRGLRTDLVLMERTYQPLPNQLPQSEMEIAKGFFILAAFTRIGISTIS